MSGMLAGNCCTSTVLEPLESRLLLDGVLGPVAVGVTPYVSTETVSQMTVSFNRPVDPNSVSLVDVSSFVGPDGQDLRAALTGVSVSDGNVTFTFTPQTQYGQYSLTLGPDITDLSGIALNQDADATNGEADQDAYTARFLVAKTPAASEDFSAGLPGASKGWSYYSTSNATVTQGALRLSYRYATWTTNLAGQSGLQLVFDTNCHDYYNGLPTSSTGLPSSGDGVMISADGQKWYAVDDFGQTSGYSASWQTRTVDLDAAIAKAGISYTNQFRIAFLGDCSGGDYRLLDNVTVSSRAVKVASSSPAALTRGTVSGIEIVFKEPIDPASFTLADITSFTGPSGEDLRGRLIDVVGSGATYTVRFAPVSTPGAYKLTLGPSIRNDTGLPMNQDDDVYVGEGADDQYAANFTILEFPFSQNFESGLPPATSGWSYYSGSSYDKAEIKTLSGGGHALWLHGTNSSSYWTEAILTLPLAGLSRLMLQFDESSGYTNASTSDNLPNTFTGHTYGKGVAISNDGVHWYRLQTQPGTLTNLTPNRIDLDAAVAAAGLSYTDNFQIKFQQSGYYDSDARVFDNIRVYQRGPRVVSQSLVLARGPVDSLTVTFDCAIDPASFTSDDITSFTGPDGQDLKSAITGIAGSGSTYVINFAGQSAAGRYNLVFGPDVRNLAGVPMNQDDDAYAGEGTDDRYAASFNVFGVPYFLDFESGLPQAINGWSYYAVSSYDKAEIKTLTSGGHALWLHGGSSPAGGSEAILTLPLAGQSGLALQFDEGSGSTSSGSIESLPSAFTGHTYGAGVTISNDGVHWYRLQTQVGTLTNLLTNSIDLDAAVAAAGISYTDNFQIKFQSAGYDAGARLFDNLWLYQRGSRVVAQSPALTQGPVDSLTVTFDRDMDPASFTSDDITSFTGPQGQDLKSTITGIAGSGKTYTISFARQSAAGRYNLAFGPDVRDSAGIPMNQNDKPPSGQTPDDGYAGGFQIGTVAYTQDFEAGLPDISRGWSYWSSDGSPSSHVRVGRDYYSGGNGSNSLIMTPSAGQLVEAVLTLDLRNQSPLDLSLNCNVMWPTLPDSFQGHYNGTGIAVSGDGQQWFGLHVNQPSGYPLKTDLALALAKGGITDLSQVRIKFQTYGGWMGLDNVRVSCPAPRLANVTPLIATAGLDKIFLTFTRPMDVNSFSVSDIMEFTSPSGQDLRSRITGFTAEGPVVAVHFEPLTAAGTYKFRLGYTVADTLGQSLDQDADGRPGESYGDDAPFTFQINATGLRVTSSSAASRMYAGAFTDLPLQFNLPVDPATLSTVPVQLIGPHGLVPGVSIFTPPVYSQRLMAFTVSTPSLPIGSYRLIIPASVRGLDGQLLDQDGDGQPGELVDDAFTMNIDVLGPEAPMRVISQQPMTTQQPATQSSPVVGLYLTFNKIPDRSSVGLDDVVSFTGPDGEDLLPQLKGLSWFWGSSGSSDKAQITFNTQTRTGQYTLVFGPNVRDFTGRLMDQDGDGIQAESGEDAYTASFWIQDVPVRVSTTSGTLFPAMPDYVDIRFSEPMDPATLDATDLTLSGSGLGSGYVQSAEMIDDLTARFHLAGPFGTGQVTRSLAGGSLATPDGRPLVAWQGTVTIDTIGPRVTSTSTGQVSGADQQYLDISYNESLDSSTVLPSLLSVTGPDGGPVTPIEFTVNYSSIRIVLDHPRAGEYSFTMQPAVKDQVGNLADQNQDGQAGQSDDVYTGTFTVGARVIGTNPPNNSKGNAIPAYVEFIVNDAIDAATVSPSDVSVSSSGVTVTNAEVLGEGGNIVRYYLASTPGATLSYVSLGNDRIMTTSGLSVSYSDLYLSLDTTAPAASVTPAGTVTDSVSEIQIRFDNSIDLASLTADALSLTGPGGAIPILSITPINGASWWFSVKFDRQTQPGDYTLTISPTVRDKAGNGLDGDGDKIFGELGQDQVSSTFTIQSIKPVVTSATPSAGAQMNGLYVVDLSFNCAIDPASVSVSDLLLSGPGADGVSVASVLVGGKNVCFKLTSNSKGGAVTVSLPAGRILAELGQSNEAFEESFTVYAGPAKVSNVVIAGDDRLVVNFTAPMDTETVRNPRNYQVLSAGTDGVFLTPDDLAMAIQSITYDPATLAATLTLPAGSLDEGAKYRLTLQGGPASSTILVGGQYGPVPGLQIGAGFIGLSTRGYAVVDYGAPRVAFLDSQGRLDASFGQNGLIQIGGPQGLMPQATQIRDIIEVVAGQTYAVTDAATGRIIFFHRDGTLATELGHAGFIDVTATTGAQIGRGLLALRNGDIAVADLGWIPDTSSGNSMMSGRVLIYRPDGSIDANRSGGVLLLPPLNSTSMQQTGPQALSGSLIEMSDGTIGIGRVEFASFAELGLQIRYFFLPADGKPYGYFGTSSYYGPAARSGTGQRPSGGGWADIAPAGPTSVAFQPNGDLCGFTVVSNYANYQGPSGSASSDRFAGRLAGMATGLMMANITTNSLWLMNMGATLPGHDRFITDIFSNRLDGDRNGAPGTEYTFTIGGRPGDMNSDGSVDVGDLGILGANYGKTAGMTWATGDMNGDGAVDVGDLAILGAHYGQGSGAGASGQLAAEPRMAGEMAIEPDIWQPADVPAPTAATVDDTQLAPRTGSAGVSADLQSVDASVPALQPYAAASPSWTSSPQAITSDAGDGETAPSSDHSLQGLDLVVVDVLSLTDLALPLSA